MFVLILLALVITTMLLLDADEPEQGYRDQLWWTADPFPRMNG